jgi:hypothetical protein
LSALRDHFDRSPAHLSPEEVAEMTALPLETVQNALSVLFKANQKPPARRDASLHHASDGLTCCESSAIATHGSRARPRAAAAA